MKQVRVLIFSFLCLSVRSDQLQQQRALRSTMWNHFSRVSQDKGKCLHCNAEISISRGSSSNLRRHLLTQHNDLYPEIDKSDSIEHESQSHFTSYESPLEEQLHLIKAEEVSFISDFIRSVPVLMY